MCARIARNHRALACRCTWMHMHVYTHNGFSLWTGESRRFLEGVPAQAEGSLFISFCIYRLLFLPSSRPAQKKITHVHDRVCFITDETQALLPHALPCTHSRARALPCTCSPVHVLSRAHPCTCSLVHVLSLVRMSLRLCVQVAQDTRSQGLHFVSTASFRPPPPPFLFS